MTLYNFVSGASRKINQRLQTVSIVGTGLNETVVQAVSGFYAKLEGLKPETAVASIPFNIESMNAINKEVDSTSERTPTKAIFIVSVKDDRKSTAERVIGEVDVDFTKSDLEIVSDFNTAFRKLMPTDPTGNYNITTDNDELGFHVFVDNIIVRI